MNGFMPSEIARLVLGYLKETCVNATNVFLDECTHLSEYRECLRNGCQYSTDIAGKSLKTVLNEYYCLKLAAGNVNSDLPLNDSRSNKIEKQLCYNHNSLSLHYSNDKNSTTSATENDDQLKSIRRKNSPKKKNNLHPTAKHTNESISQEENDNCPTEESLDVSVLLEQLMNSHALHEKIAENINITVSSNTTTESSTTEDVESHKELAIKEIVDRTESDPIFEEFLTTFFDNLKGDSSLDETQTQIELGEIENRKNKCDSKTSSDDSSPKDKNTEKVVEPNNDQMPTQSPDAEITESSVHHNDKVKSTDIGHENKSDENSTTDIAELRPNTSTPELKVPFCFPSSSNHLILKTPYKNQQCLQFITISPGEMDWAGFSNMNLLLASPCNSNDILYTTGGRNDAINNSIAATNVENCTNNLTSPSQLLKTKNRVDCHVVRDLNFGGSSTSKTKDRSPVLNTLVSSAKNIVQSDQQKGTHIRALEFKSPRKMGSQGQARSVQKVDKAVTKTVITTTNGAKDSNNGKRRKPLPLNRKLKKLKPNNRRGLSDMDVEKFLSNLCYVE